MIASIYHFEPTELHTLRDPYCNNSTLDLLSGEEFSNSPRTPSKYVEWDREMHHLGYMGIKRRGHRFGKEGMLAEFRLYNYVLERGR